MVRLRGGGELMGTRQSGEGQCHLATGEQIDRLISSAVLAAERFYPAFQLVSWGDQSPAQAMKVAIAEAYGRA